MKKIITAILALSAFTQPVLAGFEFSKSVPKDQRKLLADDFLYFAQQPLISDKKLEQLLAGPTDGLSILNWVDNRVTTIVSEDFEVQENIYVVNSSYFPSPSEVPSFETPRRVPDGNSKVKTIMSNLGGGIYVAGKMQNSLLGLKIDAKKVEVTSPRTGILQVGSGLFASQDMLKQPTEALISKYFRISTLVHEARHSDGRGKSAGFLHAICPVGHRLDGYAGCDANSNGPYSVGAQLYTVMASSCTACSVEEKEMLRKMSADSFDRVISPAPSTVQDDIQKMIISTNELLLSLCQSNRPSCTAQEIADYQAKIEAAQAALNSAQQGQASAAPAWDANPEGTFMTVTRDQTWATINEISSKNK